MRTEDPPTSVCSRKGRLKGGDMLVPLYEVLGPNSSWWYGIEITNPNQDLVPPKCKTLLYVRTWNDKPYRKRHVRVMNSYWFRQCGMFDTNTINQDWLKPNW